VIPKAGDWGGITFRDSSRDDKTMLEHVLFRYASRPLLLEQAAPTLTQIAMEQNMYNGYGLAGGIWATNRWQNTGLPYYLIGNVSIDERSVLTIAPGVVVKSADSGLQVAGALDAQGSETQPIVFTALADDTYGGDTDNNGDAVTPDAGDWGGITFRDSSRDDKTVLDYVLLRYAYHPLLLEQAAPTLTQIAMEQNMYNGYSLAGGAWATNRWQNTGLPYYLTGNVSIDERSVLTIAPGVVVKGANSGLYVAGALDAQGSETQPIVFTALADDAYGGDTDNNGDAVIPKAGDWGGITFQNTENSSKSVLNYVHLRYGPESGYVIANGATPGSFQNVIIEP
jgi:hypothetical protein